MEKNLMKENRKHQKKKKNSKREKFKEKNHLCSSIQQCYRKSFDYFQNRHLFVFLSMRSCLSNSTCTSLWFIGIGSTRCSLSNYILVSLVAFQLFTTLNPIFCPRSIVFLRRAVFFWCDRPRLYFVLTLLSCTRLSSGVMSNLFPLILDRACCSSHDLSACFRSLRFPGLSVLFSGK